MACSYSGLGHAADEVGVVDTEQGAEALRHHVRGDGRLLAATTTAQHLDIPKQQDGRHDAPHRLDLLAGEAHDAKGIVGGGKLLLVVHVSKGDAAVAHEAVLLGVFQPQVGNVGLVRAGQQLVEGMEVALVAVLADGTGLLQQVGVDGGANDKARDVKVDADELALEDRRADVREGVRANGRGLQACRQASLQSGTSCRS